VCAKPTPSKADVNFIKRVVAAEEWIIGEAFATYWPPKRIGLL
jgi:hypothetical protein